MRGASDALHKNVNGAPTLAWKMASNRFPNRFRNFIKIRQQFLNILAKMAQNGDLEEVWGDEGDLMNNVILFVSKLRRNHI